MPLHRVLSRLGLAFFLVVAVGATPAYAANSPQGDVAAPWPAAWSTYRLANGVPVADVLGDENPDNADLSSGPCSGSGCTGPSPTVYYASDGTNVFFRIRLAVDPSDATKGGLTGNAYLTQIAVGGTVVAVAGVDGKSASVDYVYVASAPGTTVTPIYEYPFTATSAGMRVLPDGAGQWFLDYQVPIARLIAVSGGALTATAPIQLYYGSSAAANLATLNKDLMLGAVNTVSFTNLSVVSLSPSTLSATSGAVLTSGPSPTVGQASRYTVTWTMTNAGGGELSTAAATATLPSGVAFVSGSGVSVSGSTVTWDAGLLLPGETDTVTFVVDLTPGTGTEGTNVPLLSAVSATGTDVGTSSARTASAPALSVGPVAAAPPANAVPVAAADALTVAEDASNTVDVLANDSDADGDPLTVTVTGAPAHGTTSVAAGVVTYTPSPGYNGPDSFIYTVCDPSDACASATVTVTVTPVNDAPAALAGTSFTTPEDTAYAGSLPAGTDPDGDALTYSVTTPPSHGTVVVDGDGTFTYTPAPGYDGPDSFGYQVCDGGGLCSGATATVTVADVPPPPNVPPVAVDDAATAAFGTPVVVDVLANDTDTGPLTVTAVTQGANGTVAITTGGVTYTPGSGFAGTDTFTYTVCDALDACDTGTVTVTVLAAPNAPPVANAGPDQTVNGGVVQLDGTGSSDADGDTLTYAWVRVSGPAVTLVGANTATPAFAAPASGTVVLQLTVSDGTDSDTDTVSIVRALVVVDPPPAPSCDDEAVVTSNGSSVVVTLGCVTGNATVTVVDGPEHGDAEVLNDGSIRYVPDPGYSGPDAFTVRVCTSGGCSDAVVTVRNRAARASRLPDTGGGLVEALLPVAFVLILLGATASRSGRRARASTA